MKTLMFVSVFIALLLTGGKVIAEDEPKVEMGISEYSHTDQDHIQKTPKESKSTTDHSKLKELQGPFSSGPEVTKACLKCHNKAGHQFMKNKHWTWKHTHPKTGQKLGKGVLINNFCTNAKGNEGMCAQCHAGYNMTDSNFDFSNQENMDCLVCHESTGTYYKTPTTKGNKSCSVMFEGKPPIEWAKVAQSVAMPSRNNCGKCHFYGGGGDNVKHGDLSSVLLNPPKDVDVHMSADGEDFTCVTCHVGEGHEWAGSRYEMLVNDKVGTGKPGMPREVASCESCHSASPHSTNTIAGIKLNNHTKVVACETCHIPEIARGGVATQIDWDWRTMGKLKNGEGFKLKEYTQGDGHHRATYKSIKGTFTYAENLEPMYAWFDGTMRYITIDTKFDPSKGPIDINSFSGSHDDPNSRIYPFKRMHTTMPYDKGNNTLVYMNLWGNDGNALWGTYDFSKAIETGMKKNGIPYSGEWGFIKTYSYWPINHMVAPKKDALECAECHSKAGRLSHLKGFYMPGTGNKLLDIIALLAILGTLGGVLGHATLRKITSSRRKK
ncbi:tetrathionate reductase family octaheme c-type cytochrome [Candidatus Marithrix sp. Canyon 246]|uniref:tetrathionate reductase family octaheme c-type cytochrome n=1 Tax=Candidatus Marithrix sp. Canyon 246 TaxID=1827136 RepID=UPI00084A1104|nr:tetrathionate reductase family octaheme c-type cytochrome [Candidatus Marithrix sp. Canyon 246]